MTQNLHAPGIRVVDATWPDIESRLLAGATAPAPIERGLFNRHRPDAPNYSPDGVNGDPTLATAEKGEALAAALWRDVNDFIASVL